MNKLGLLKQRGLCGVSCVSARACNPAPKVPLSKTFWLTFKFVPVIQKFSRASQVITCVIQSPTAKPLQSSQACHLISLSLSDDSAEPEVFLANNQSCQLSKSQLTMCKPTGQANFATQSYSSGKVQSNTYHHFIVYYSIANFLTTTSPATCSKYQLQLQLRVETSLHTVVRQVKVQLLYTLQEHKVSIKATILVSLREQRGLRSIIVCQQELAAPPQKFHFFKCFD